MDLCITIYLRTHESSEVLVIHGCVVGMYVWGVCVCVWGVVGGCVCLAYTSEDFHMKTHRYTEDSTPSEDPKTGPRKTLAKNAKTVMFYHLRGVRAPRTSTDFQPYLIYEDIRVLGSISKASGCVLACVGCVGVGGCVCVCVCWVGGVGWFMGRICVLFVSMETCFYLL